MRPRPRVTEQGAPSREAPARLVSAAPLGLRAQRAQGAELPGPPGRRRDRLDRLEDQRDPGPDTRRPRGDVPPGKPGPRPPALAIVTLPPRHATPVAPLPSPPTLQKIHLWVTGSNTCVPSTPGPGTFPRMSSQTSTTPLPKETSCLPPSNLLLLCFSPTRARTTPNLLKRATGSVLSPTSSPSTLLCSRWTSSPTPSSHRDPVRLWGLSDFTFVPQSLLSRLKSGGLYLYLRQMNFSFYHS